MRKKNFRLPIYNQFLIQFFITDDIISYYNKITKSIDTSSCDGITFYNGSNIFIGVKPNSSIGVISHECFHATAYIMDVIGCELKEESEEPYAYLLGYLVEEFVKFKDK